MNELRTDIRKERPRRLSWRWRTSFWMQSTLMSYSQVCGSIVLDLHFRLDCSGMCICQDVRRSLHWISCAQTRFRNWHCNVHFRNLWTIHTTVFNIAMSTDLLDYLELSIHYVENSSRVKKSSLALAMFFAAAVIKPKSYLIHLCVLQQTEAFDLWLSCCQFEESPDLLESQDVTDTLGTCSLTQYFNANEVRRKCLHSAKADQCIGHLQIVNLTRQLQKTREVSRPRGSYVTK